MKNLLLILFVAALAPAGFGQTKPIEYSIDEKIRAVVESKINDSLFLDLPMQGMQMYMNPMILDYWENDSLLLSRNNPKQGMVFKSFFYNLGDTLIIDGAYGMFGGTGFSIKFIDGAPVVYHMLASDEIPSYSETVDGELQYRIEVPCEHVKLTLSSIPIIGDTNEIYGMVSFTSKDYYHSVGTSNGEEIKPRNKTKVYMKIYFKSGYFDVDKMR